MCERLAEVLAQRQPPPGTSQHDLLTKRFWTGRQFFVVVRRHHAPGTPPRTRWPRWCGFVEQGADLGLHIIATADIRSWSFQSQGNGVLGRMVGALPPVIALDGRRSHGQIMNGVYAEPSGPAKAS